MAKLDIGVVLSCFKNLLTLAPCRVINTIACVPQKNSFWQAMHSTVTTEPGMRDLEGKPTEYFFFYNQINERPLIGQSALVQSAMVFCADKLMEKFRVF